jgi:uncharacterized protein
MRALLDVNVLLALFDQDHLHHERARAWLESEIRHGWASCALTQNGLVRILSQPSYPNPLSPNEAAERLRAATGERHHEFWDCSISLLDASRFDLRRVHGPRQVTGWSRSTAASPAAPFNGPSPGTWFLSEG